MLGCDGHHVTALLHNLSIALVQGLVCQKLLSYCHSQELGQLADLASDWLLILVKPIRSQLTDLASDCLFTLVQPIRSQLAG